MLKKTIGLWSIFLEKAKAFVLVTAIFFTSYINPSYAAHPLITDDTGTQGKGKFQLEAQSEFVFDKFKEDAVEIKTTVGQLQGVLTYGILENLDLVLTVPYVWAKVKEDGLTAYDERGISDLSFEAKWRFWELQDSSLSFALKPTITIPTGDDKKGLGSGRATYGITFITTKEFKPLALHLNLGYTYNDNKLDERKDLWKLSTALEAEVIKDLKLVTEIGVQKNPDRQSKTNPAFVTGGLIYSVTDNLDLDFGIRAGLNRVEPDMTILAGVTLRF